MSSNVPSVPYGVKTIKQLRKSTRSKVGPSPALASVKSTLSEYFLQKVDPLMADCVTRLLFFQPDDIVIELINYLTIRKEKGSISVNNEVPSTTKTKKSHKIFLATRISPIVSQLMNLIAKERPDDVLNFMLTCLQKMSKEPTPTKNKNNKMKNNTPLRPSTAVVHNASKNNNNNNIQYAIDARPTTAPSTRTEVETEDTVVKNEMKEIPTPQVEEEFQKDAESEIVYTVNDGVEAHRTSTGVKWYAGTVVECEKEEGILLGTYSIKFLQDNEIIKGISGDKMRKWTAGEDGCNNVQVRYAGGSRYHAGTVVKSYGTPGSSDRILDIKYNDGRIEQSVPESRIRSTNTGIGSLEINELVEARYNGGRLWFKGKITNINKDNNTCYEITYDDGDIEHDVPMTLVRSLEDSTSDKTKSQTTEVNNFIIGSKVKHSDGPLGTIITINKDGSFEVSLDAGTTLSSVKESEIELAPSFPLIEARYKDGDEWFPGCIICENVDGTFNIDYDDGDTEDNVTIARIRKRSKAPEPLQIGSPVRVRYKGGSKWYPGNVSSANRDGTYGIAYNDGDAEQYVQPRLIKFDPTSPASSPTKIKPTPSNLDINNDSSNEGEVVTTKEVEMYVSEGAITAKYSKGNYVEGRYARGAKWYPGRIAKVNGDIPTTYTIRYNDGEVEENVLPKFLRLQDNILAPLEKYESGTEVDVRKKGGDEYVRASIIQRRPDNSYDVRYIEDGQSESGVPPQNVRSLSVTLTEATSKASTMVNEIITEIVSPKPREIVIQQMTITMLGVDGAGKTSFLNALQGEPGARVRPTTGFKPLSMMLGEDLKVSMYDLGGMKKIRGIWKQYFHDSHAFIYVVDSAADDEKWNESVQVFKDTRSTFTTDGIDDKPFLVLATKTDLESSRSMDTLISDLEINTTNNSSNIELRRCTTQVVDTDTGSGDPSLEEAAEWLIASTKERLDELDVRVKAAIEKRKVEEKARKLARERKVLKNKIASAFPSKVAVDKLPPGVTPESEPEDVFTEDEALEFLSSEIGLTPATLPDLAKEVAVLAGYQRLALQIIGGLRVPISKKKEPLEWPELMEMVKTIRKELELDN